MLNVSLILLHKWESLSWFVQALFDDNFNFTTGNKIQAGVDYSQRPNRFQI